MPCPITLQNLTSSPITVVGLYNLVVPANSAELDVSTLASLDYIRNLSELATRINNNQLRLKIGSYVVTDLSLLCPQSGSLQTWIQTISATTIPASTIYTLNELPIIIPEACKLIFVGIFAGSGNGLTISLQRSTDNGQTWANFGSATYGGNSNSLIVSANVDLVANTWVRAVTNGSGGPFTDVAVDLLFSKRSL